MKKILSTITTLTLLLSISILSAAYFNYDTGLALKAKNASEATMTAMEKRYDKILSVGVHGIILSSEDSGSTWRQVDRVPFSNTLTDIYCVSDTQCWAIGHDASIFHTIDSGETWTLQYEDEFFDAPLLSIYMSDYLYGVAIGAFGTSLKTDNGGETWEKALVTDDPYEPHLNYIFSSSRMKGMMGNDLIFVVGELGQIHVSDNDGKSWRLIDTGYFGSLWGGISVNQTQMILLGMSGKVLLVTFEDEKLNDFKVETIFIGIKNSLTEIKKLKNGKFVVSGNGGVISIIDMENKTTETCIRGDRLSNTSVIEIDRDKYLLSGEKGFRSHSMEECQKNFEDADSNSKDMWMKNSFQYLDANL